MLSEQIAIPEVKGLVLAGGRSTRMGQDKGLLNWHGKPQREFLVDVLHAAGLDAFISCRPDQAPELPGIPLIIDEKEGLGPLGALQSAFSRYPAIAWLAIACDMPLLDSETIKYLLENRHPGFAATAFRAPAFSDGSPDPLCAIWEPSIASIIEQRLKNDQRCARKTLLEAGVFVLEPIDEHRLCNINTPLERERLEGNAKRYSVHLRP